MGRCNGNITAVKKKIKPLTLKQLKKWGVKYHKIYFGKPSFDLFIDCILYTSDAADESLRVDI